MGLNGHCDRLYDGTREERLQYRGSRQRDAEEGLRSHHRAVQQWQAGHRHCRGRQAAGGGSGSGGDDRWQMELPDELQMTL